MIKNYVLLIMLMVSFKLFSQEAYFLTGSTFTKYSFKSSEGAMITALQSGTGASYEMGYCVPLKNQKICYEIGISLNDHNALAGSPASSYQWETKYVGLENAVRFNFAVSNTIQLVFNGGIQLSTIIYGKQTVNGVVYDLLGQDEFSGVLFSPFVGGSTCYQLNDIGFLSVGYRFSTSSNPFNGSPDKLSFHTGQLQFGIHFNINNN